MDDLLPDFLTETNESLGELDLALVRLERNPADRDTLSLIFRLVHTIKGTCGFLGLPRLERVAHAAENVLGQLREGELSVTPEVISLVLGALDRMKLIVAGLAAQGAEPAGDDASLVAALDALEAGAPAPPPAPEPVEPGRAAPPEVAESAGGGPQTVRVGVELLENLMTLVSELVLTRNQLLQLGRSQDGSPFAAPLQRLSQITSDLQEGVMKTRMQPIGNAWNKLPRLVRDLARDMGKRIELSMEGADTELDRQVLELIRDPLTHMVRNSADHGLEGPAERRGAGKPETGRIALNAFHEGGHIVIEIADDGRGLPVGRIRDKALTRGLATEAELAAMTEAQIHAFIFHPGFSTADSVTAVSGRGVGMDVVKTNIEKIGGTIGLRSRPGQGATFTIKIPLTLAIVSALIVESAGERFAVPQISVMELVRPREAAAASGRNGAEPVIEHLDGAPVLRLRDRLLPLVPLDQALGLAPPGRRDGAEGRIVIVARIGAHVAGLVVDRVFDTEEIVVKPVAPMLRHMAMFSGNTILGDGSVIMILDPAGLARASGLARDLGGGGLHGEGEARPAPAAQAAARSDDRTAMLIFRAGGTGPKAVPLGLVARLENIPRESIESAAGCPVTQYRGRLMKLVAIEGGGASEGPVQPVLVFAEGERSAGLMVDEIVDVAEERLHVELRAGRPGLLGTAVIAGRATDVIDTSYWLERAGEDWFRNAGASHGAEAGAGAARRPRLLVVEDSDFFRQMLVPALAAAGYAVTAVPGASRALALREAGQGFDAIVSDIEMPEMDGLEFARRVRAAGAWAGLPLIALTGRAGAADELAGREAGFTDYVAKFDRAALLDSLRQCLDAGGTGAETAPRLAA